MWRTKFGLRSLFPWGESGERGLGFGRVGLFKRARLGRLGIKSILA